MWCPSRRRRFPSPVPAAGCCQQRVDPIRPAEQMSMDAGQEGARGTAQALCNSLGAQEGGGGGRVTSTGFAWSSMKPRGSIAGMCTPLCTVKPVL